MHDDAQSTAVQIRNNVQFAVGQNPEQAAQYQHLAKYVGVPVETVQAHPDVVKQQAALKSMDADQLVSDYPKLATYLTDPNNTAKSHDDIAPLAAVERATKALPAPSTNAQPPSFGDTVAGLPMDFAKGLGGAFNKAATGVNVVLGAFPTLYDKAASLITGKQTTAASDAWFRNMVDPRVEAAPSYALAPDAPFASKAVHTVGNLTGMLSQITLTGGGGEAAGAAGTTAEVLGNQMAHGAKAMAFPAITDAVDTGRQVYAATGDAQQAIRAAQMQYATSTAAGVVPLSAPGGIATRLAGGFASGAASGETSRNAMNLVLPTSMQQHFDVEGAILSGLAGSLLGGVMGPRAEPSYHEALRQTYVDASKAEAAQHGMASLQALSELASSSKTRERDPDAFKEFVRSATEDGQLQEVYVDANKFAEVLNQSGVDIKALANTMPEVAEQFAAAVQTNGDIRIPVEDYATHIAGGKIDAALLPHLKVEPDGFTYQQGQEYFQNQRADMQAQAEKILAAKQSDDAAAAEGQVVHDKVLDQLNANGRFRPEVNNAYAALSRDFYRTMSERTGLTPAELYERYPLKVTSEALAGLDQSGRTVEVDGMRRPIENSDGERIALNFGDQVGFWKWYGDGKVDAHGRPLAVEGKYINGAGETREVEQGTYAQNGVDGPFGPVTDKFKGDAAGAIEHLKQQRTGEAIGALHHPDIGDIDLVWGKEGTGKSDGYGLAKLIKFHPEVVDNLQDILSSMGVVSRSDNRIRLESSDHQAAVRLTWDGQAKKWLMTAFEKREKGGGASTRTDTAGLSGEGDTARPTAAEESSIDQDLNNFYQGNRGSFDPATGTISLLRNADLSTFLHESGHFFLETMHDMASAADAPEQIRGDFDTLLKSFGVEGETAEQRLADWTGRTLDQKRDGHEQFARSFEAYLMEGKAPTLELQGLFARFRSWLVNIYKSLSSLNVELTPEVRGVMDRLLASDEAIRYAEQARGYLPLEKAPEGVSAEQFAAYQALGKEATDQAVADLGARSLRDMQWASNAKAKALRALQKQADTQRKAIREEVTKEVMESPVRQAEAYLKRKGGTDPAPAAEAKAWQEARDAQRTQLLEEVKGEYLAKPEAEGAKGLKKGQYLAKNKRAIENEAERRLIAWEQHNPRPARPKVDNDIVAEMFGFESGKELKDAIAAAGKVKDEIDGLTDQRMLERHGELVDADSIERAAEAAIHNEARARFMATGLKMLSKSPVPARQLAEAAQAAAEAAIAAKRVRDLRPAQHAAEEARANRDAIKLAPKDPRGAVQAQRAALLNNRLFKAATDAVAEVQKGLDYLKKFDKPAVREKIALEYRDQIDALLDRFDLRKSTTLTALDMRESLLAFVERMAAQGLEPQVPEALLNEARTQHFKDMTVEEFRGLVDAVKSIDHLGRKAQLVADGQEMREIATLAEEAAKAMAELPQRAPESNRGLTRLESKWLGIKSAGRSMQAALLKMEQMMDWLDNRNPNGVLNRVVFRRIADAGVHEADLQARIKAGIDELLHSKLADVTREKGRIYEAPGLIDGLTGKPQRFTKKEMLALAGNMGNDSNLAKLLAGEKWSETAVWSFLHENMSKADWDFVAGLGKTLESLWPEKLAMSRRLGNTNPEKIAPRPFDTPHGRYEGWYWPMVYDPARAQDVAERGAKAGDSLFENIYTKANTDTGRMTTRNENYARPLLLSLDVIPRVIKDEIHDIAYREAIMDADKILSHPVMRDAITDALSPEHYAQLRPWLQSIANDRKVDMQALKWFDALAHGARTRATIVGLGYRISTMLVHGSSAALESVAEVGPVWFAKGLADFANPRNWAANRDFVFERSGEMRNRMNEVDRDVREHLREIDLRLMDTTTSALARGTDLMKAHAYQGIAMLDMASALPTWMAAYHKGMAPEGQGGKGLSEQDAVYFADKTVRNAHGGTGVKDLAAVQRGPEFFKLFTMFYTFWNHNINRLMDTGRMAMDGATWRDSNKASTVIMRFLIYTLGVQTMHHMLHPKTDDEGETNWLAWAGKELGSAAFAGIPILRDLSAHYLTGKDYSATPAAGMVDAVGKSGVDAANVLTGQEANPKALKHTITTAGYVFGLPLGQPASSAQFLWDVTQGKQDPQDVADWWRGLIHGDMQKH
ncbi:MAG: putative barnase/colicin E5 family endoribonuclease [Telluria sp.]